MDKLTVDDKDEMRFRNCDGGGGVVWDSLVLPPFTQSLHVCIPASPRITIMQLCL
jgi:hypothetical protein